MKTLHRVLNNVGNVCVKGVGTWEPAWIHTRKVNDKFDLAFDKWVAKDTKATREELVEASDLFVEAWQRASDMFKHHQVEGF